MNGNQPTMYSAIDIEKRCALADWIARIFAITALGTSKLNLRFLHTPVTKYFSDNTFASLWRIIGCDHIARSEICRCDYVRVYIWTFHNLEVADISL